MADAVVSKNPICEVSAEKGHDDQKSFSLTPFRIFLYLKAFYFFLVTMVVVPLSCSASVFIIYPLVPLNLLNVYNVMEQFLCRMVTEVWVSVGWLAGLRVFTSGDDLSHLSEEHCLFLSNHIAMVDHFILLSALRKVGTVGHRWMWVIFNFWRWTPIGIMWGAHGSFFVREGKSTRSNFMNELQEMLRKTFKKFNFGWIIMYPEGSRFFLIKESSRRFSEKNGLPPLLHCSYPRMGVANVIMKEMGPDVNGNLSPDGLRYVIDATLGYPNEEVSLEKSILDESLSVAIHLEAFPVDPAWKEEKVFTKWMYDRYEKKDRLLDDFYRNGSFPGEKKAMGMETIEIIRTHVFWWILYFVHYYIWIGPLLRGIASLFGI